MTEVLRAMHQPGRNHDFVPALFPGVEVTSLEKVFESLEAARRVRQDWSYTNCAMA